VRQRFRNRDKQEIEESPPKEHIKWPQTSGEQQRRRVNSIAAAHDYQPSLNTIKSNIYLNLGGSESQRDNSVLLGPTTADREFVL